MIQKILCLYGLVAVLNISQAVSLTEIHPSKSIQDNMKSLSNLGKISTKVSEDFLLPPYNYLLLQPLMTTGIEKYYQRTPLIQTVYAIKNQHDNTYYRAILMLVDNNKARNNVLLAQRKKEVMVVELAFITINFNALPKKLIGDVLKTNIPFGKLLSKNHLKIYTTDRSYFSVNCDKVLASITGCHLNLKLYGRTNTIVKADNHKWLAHVVEILPGF